MKIRFSQILVLILWSLLLNMGIQDINNIASCESVLTPSRLSSRPFSSGASLFNAMERTKAPLCMCGCGEPVGKHAWKKNKWNMYLVGHAQKGAVFSKEHKRKLSENKIRFYNKPTPVSIKCSCGCGEMTKPGNIYIRGHNHKNKKPSLAHCRNISKAKKGVPIPEYRKKLISITLKERFKNKENHPRWLGGISTEEYSEEFNDKLKTFIRKSYQYTCQICKKHENEFSEKLCVHHIDYNKRNNNLSNLLPLCRNCHSRTNHKRKKWQKRLSKKVRFLI